MKQNRHLNRVMEAGDHFKNGASPKSQMSRGNWSLYFFLLIIAFTFISWENGDKNDDDSDNDNNNPTTSVFTTIEMNIHRDMPYISSDEVRVTVYKRSEDGGGTQVVAQAALSSNPSQVKLTFKDVSDEYLYSIESAFKNGYAFWPDWALAMNEIAELNVSNRKTRIAIASVCSYYQGNGPTNYFRNGDYDVGFIYSNSDCNITGIAVAVFTRNTPAIYDIQLKKGWNMIVRKGNHLTEYHILTKLIKGGTWRYGVG